MVAEFRTLVIGGQARLPKELSPTEVFQVVVELNVERGEIVDCSFKPCLPTIEKILKKIMIGANLEKQGGEILEAVEKQLYHRSKKAVISAIKDLFREYREYRYR